MNYLSSEYRIQNPPQYGDLRILDNVMSTLQGRYDANKAQIDQTLALYNQNLKGIRPEDNAYIAQKLKDVKTQIDTLSKKNGNLARSYNKDSIMSAITSTLEDPIVMDAITSRQNDMALNAQIEEARKKDPKLVDQANIKFARHQGGFDDYMAGKTNKLGAMNYDVYTDFNKELQDVANNLDKYDTDIKKSYVDGQGYKFTKEGKIIDPNKVKSIAQGFLSNGAKKQMVINGFASIYTGNTEEERKNNTKIAFDEYSKSSLLSENEKVIGYESTYKKTGLPQDKENAKKARENYDNFGKQLKEIGDSGNSQAMYGTIYTEKTLDNFAKNFSYNTVDITEISNDVTYKNRVDEQYRAGRDVVQDAQSDRTYALSVKAQELAEAKAFPGGKGNSFQAKSTMNEVKDESDAEMKASKEITDLDTTIGSIINPIYQGFDAKQKEEIDVQVRNSKGTKTIADVIMEYKNSHEGIISVADADRLNLLMGDKMVKQEDYNKKRESIIKKNESLLQSASFYQEVFTRPEVKIMWKGVDGKERMYSLKDVLLNNKMVDKNGKKTDVSNPVVLEAIKKSVLADKTLSSTQTFDYSTHLKQLAESMGEDINKIIKKGTTQYISGSGMGQYRGAEFTSQTLDPNSKTAQFLKKHKDNKGYNIKNRFQNDDSFDDIDALKPYFKAVDQEEVRKEVGKLLIADKNVTFGKVITVRPGTREYEDIAQQAGFKIDDKTPIFITKVDGQPELVNITLGQGSSKKIEATTVGVTAELQIRDLSENVRSQVAHLPWL